MCRLYEQGQVQGAVRILRKHRCVLMNSLHESQEKIDCLDFLVRRMEKKNHETSIAAVDIMDENGSMTLPVTGGDNLTENYVGANFKNYDYFVVLSHFKGHSMAGFGGAIKNISIGIASSEGKSWIHTGGTSTSGWSGDQDAFLESMAEPDISAFWLPLTRRH